MTTILRSILVASSILGIAVPSLLAEVQTWTMGTGATLQGEYVRSTEDAVIVKRSPDGQIFRLPLKDCSENERAYVAGKQKEEKEANTIEAKVHGVIDWRLPGWNSLSWSNKQPAELWSWNETTRTPVEKIADLSVEYNRDLNPTRNQFTGKFVSDGRVRLLKTDKFVVKGKFACSVNGGDKNLEQISAPFPLPNVLKDDLDIGIFRFSLTR
jgi:hypothetical protein